MLIKRPLLLVLASRLSAVAAPPEAVPTANVVYGSQTSQPADAQEITGLIARQYEAANARDFDTFMAPYWHSPLLVDVVDGAVWTGWAEVRGHLEREYPSKDQMGRAVLERLQTHFVDAGTAITLEYWTVYFPRSKVHGTTVSNWRKLPEGWRMVQTSTSSTELP